jgi:hypothetical protein
LTIAIQNIQAISATVVRVQFDAPVDRDPFYLDPDHYCFNEGLEALGVVIYQPNIVDVMTTTQETDKMYRLEMGQ